MARNRVIYQSEALFVGPDSTSGHYSVPVDVTVNRLAGATQTAGTIRLTTSKVSSSTDFANLNTVVKMSGIYTKPQGQPSSPFAPGASVRFDYSTINAAFGEIAATDGGVAPHTHSATRLVRAFPASGSELGFYDGNASARVGSQDGATGIALMLPHPLTSIAFSGHSGTAAQGLLNAWGFTGWIPVTNRVKQLIRVQSANYGFDIGRTDVNQFGNLAAIDRIILEQPTVSLDFSYLLSSGQNEERLGFGVKNENSAVGNFLSGIGDSRNYWIYVADEGNDANNPGAANHAKAKSIGIGNAFLTSYTSEGAVGDFPTASLNAEALNMRFYVKNSGDNPAVEPVNGKNYSGSFQLPTPMKWHSGYNASVDSLEPTALRPGDVTMTLTNKGTKGVLVTDLKLQSFSFNFDLGREPLQKLGSKFAFSREISFPVTATMSVDAVLGEVEAGNLADVVASDTTEYDVGVRINAPGTTTRAIEYTLKGAKLESQSFTSSIGDNKSVSLEWASQVGGPQDVTHGIKMQVQDHDAS